MSATPQLTPLERARIRFDATRVVLEQALEDLENAPSVLLPGAARRYVAIAEMERSLCERAALALIAEILRDPDHTSTAKTYALLGEVRAIAQQAQLLP